MSIAKSTASIPTDPGHKLMLTSQFPFSLEYILSWSPVKLDSTSTQMRLTHRHSCFTFCMRIASPGFKDRSPWVRLFLLMDFSRRPRYDSEDRAKLAIKRLVSISVKLVILLRWLLLHEGITLTAHNPTIHKHFLRATSHEHAR